ncbi:MAG: hypothetical protein JXJ22_10750 [Bacteroidales bacterium]|nr:hypothetical protein [Bacteroidales bacterium]
MNRFIYFWLLILSLFVFSCVDENLTNISDNVQFKVTYSLPIGPLSYDINDYFESIDTLISGVLDSVEYEDSLLPNPQVYVEIYEYEHVDFSMMQNYLENAVYLMFRINLINRFPTPADLQVYFTDAFLNITDSLFAEGPWHIPPAETDDNGKIISPYSEQLDIEFDRDGIENLLFTQYLLINGRVYTVLDNVDAVKFYSDYNLAIQLGFRLGLELTTRDF